VSREPRTCKLCWEETFRFLTISFPLGALGADGRRYSRFEDETWVFVGDTSLQEKDVVCDDCFIGLIEAGNVERLDEC
jgi:hypothetical protein